MVSNPFLNQRNENKRAARERAAAADPKRGGGGGGGGGGGNPNKKDRPGGADGIVGEKERQFWEQNNPETYWNSFIGNSDESLGGNNTDFADWFNSTYFDQVYKAYQNEVNSINSKPGSDKLKWGQYVRDYLGNTPQVTEDWNRYYAEENKDAATQAMFARSGMGAVNDSDSAFGDWLNKKVGSQFQTEYQQLNDPQTDYYEFLKNKMGGAAYDNYYNQYMLDPTRVSATYGPARWQAF